MDSRRDYGEGRGGRDGKRSGYDSYHGERDRGDRRDEDRGRSSRDVRDKESYYRSSDRDRDRGRFGREDYRERKRGRGRGDSSYSSRSVDTENTRFPWRSWKRRRERLPSSEGCEQRGCQAELQVMQKKKNVWQEPESVWKREPSFSLLPI